MSTRVASIPLLRQPPEVPDLRQHLQREGGRRQARGARAGAAAPDAAGAAAVRRRHGRRDRALADDAHDPPAVPDRAAAGRREGDQPRGRAPRPREDARPLLRARQHGARDHEPELRQRAVAGAARTRRSRVNWQVVRLEGSSANEFGDQIEALEPALAHGWETQAEPDRPATRRYVRPSVLVVYRADHEFVLDSVIPRRGTAPGAYDFVLASQPWRARTSADVQGARRSSRRSRAASRPAAACWSSSPTATTRAPRSCDGCGPSENPFPVGRGELLDALRGELGDEAGDFDLTDPPDDGALFRYEMHTLPSEIGDRIGTSTLFAAWNAVIYVNQIEDERLDPVVASGAYLDATQEALHEHGGLWFNDEAFVVVAPPQLTLRHAARRGAASGARPAPPGARSAPGRRARRRSARAAARRRAAPSRGGGSARSSAAARTCPRTACR